MKINFFDVIVCYIMRYKYALLSLVVAINLAFFIKSNVIICIIFPTLVLFLECIYNNIILNESILKHNGIIKKYMANKYIDVLKDIHVMIYDDNNINYEYLEFSKYKTYYESNVYFFILKSCMGYLRKECIIYEFKNNGKILFISNSKDKLNVELLSILTKKIRKIYFYMYNQKKIANMYSEVVENLSYYDD